MYPCEIYEIVIQFSYIDIGEKNKNITDTDHEQIETDLLNLSPEQTA
jgi:hypothetical protein